MIPIELRLRNFLSYGEDVPPLDFTSFKLACLTGRNGHGKSAILDALTWAVWGEARKAGYSRSPDADLLRQSAGEMFVEFTFSLSGSEYQVYREYHSKRRTGKLEFRSRKNRDDAFIILTGNSKRDTQQRINQVLGLDYRTFVNSSFLQQGKADEFTRQPPKDRKEILCTILGLDYYDRLLDEAKLRLNAVRAERKVLDDSLASIQLELEEEESIIEREKSLSALLQEKDNALDILHSGIKEIREQIAGLLHVRERIESGRAEETRIQKRLQEIAAREEKYRAEKNDSLALTAREADIETRYRRHEEIGKQLHDLLAVDERHDRLNAQRIALEKTIDEQRNLLQVQLASLKSESGQIQKTKTECRPLLDARQAIEERYTAFQKIAAEFQSLQAQKPAYDALQKQIAETGQRIEQERQRIAEQIAERRGATQNIPKIRQEIARIKLALEQKPAQQSECQQIRERLQSLVEEGQENNSLRERALADLDRCMKTLQETHEKRELLQSGQTRECPLCNSPLDPTRRESLLQRLQDEIQLLQIQIPALQQQIQERDKRRGELLTAHQMEEKNRAKNELELNQLLLLETNLPACEADLNRVLLLEEEIKQLAESLEKKQFALEARTEHERLQNVLKTVDFDPARAATAAQQLNEQRQAEVRWNQLQNALERQTQWEKRESEIAALITALQKRLDEGDFARDEQQQRQSLLQEIEPLRQSLERRKSLSTEQKELSNAPIEWHRLQTAKQRLPLLERELEQTRQERGENLAHLREIAAEREKAAPQIQELTTHQQTLTVQEIQLAEREKERGELQIQLGGVRHKLEHLQKRKAELKSKRERISQAERDERLYKILTAAFSRNGIPAMIVDQSLPELENDANALLHRLTNGRCSVAFESQRETKTGGMSETLDIKISDEMGTRDYEMFSGGEAFRTDLALRIALSQLLCRRAGSKLQLLVIDEGFGTQDAEGIGHIVDAIHEIQDEFEKIIVVTHLDEMKERFPVRIEVTKELGIGSRFEIVYSL